MRGRLDAFFHPPIIEGLILLGAIPWLLFPTINPIVTAIALLVVAAIWLWPWLRSDLPFCPTPFNGAILLWLVMLLIGIIVTADPDKTLAKATGLILGVTVWRYIAMRIGDRFQLRIAVVFFFLAVLGFILLGSAGAEWRFEIGFIETLIDRLPPQLVQLPEAPEQGVHANQLAGIVAFFLPIVLSVLIGWRMKRSRIVVLAGLIVILIITAAVLVLTQSRSGWLGALAGIATLLLAWGLVLPKSRRRAVFLLCFTALVVILLLVIILIGPARMREFWEEPAQETVIGNLGSINFRIEVWQWAISAIRDFPLTGTGLGSFHVVVHRLYPIAIPESYNKVHAHNIFLQVALDTGIPGLISYLSIIGLAIVAGWRVARRSPEFRPLAIGLIASFVAFHVFGLLDALVPGSKPGLVLWMSLGMMAAMERISNPKQHARNRPAKVESAILDGVDHV